MKQKIRQKGAAHDERKESVGKPGQGEFAPRIQGRSRRITSTADGVGASESMVSWNPLTGPGSRTAARCDW